MAESEIHWGILKPCLNIYLKILLLSDLLDGDCSKNQSLILQDSTQASCDSEREKLLKPCFEKCLTWAHGSSHCAHALLLSTAENPSLVKVLKDKIKDLFQQFWGSSLVEAKNFTCSNQQEHKGKELCLKFCFSSIPLPPWDSVLPFQKMINTDFFGVCSTFPFCPKQRKDLLHTLNNFQDGIPATSIQQWVCKTGST